MDFLTVARPKSVDKRQEHDVMDQMDCIFAVVSCSSVIYF
jgi:hypothetical protein